MRYHNVRLWAVLAVIAALAIGSPAAAVTNLLTNPGFETGYTGWFTFGPNVLISNAGNDNIMRSGTGASKIYGGFPMCPVPSFNVSGCGQAFTSPTVGRLYEFKGYSYVSSADVIPGTEVCAYNRMIAKIVFFNAASGGAEIGSNEIVIGDFDTPTDQWIPFNVTAIVPTGALRVEALLLYLQPACDGGAVFADDLSFGILPPLPTVTNQLVNGNFNGNLTGWTVFGNVYYDARYWARRTPAGSAKMYSTFNPAFNSGMYQEFAAAPASRHRFDVFVMTTCFESPIQGTNTNTVLARVVYLDAALNEIGSKEATVVDNTAPLGTWREFTVITDPAPAGTAHVRPYVLFISPNSEGGAIWVDDAYFGAVVGTGVGDTPAPITLSVYPNVPNPFGQNTRIDFDLAYPDNVEVSVYDVA
ncbi:MAG TPA: hypothetical protein VF247_11905, partial [Candidatus Krumholzibacteria bacterium]